VFAGSAYSIQSLAQFVDHCFPGKRLLPSEVTFLTLKGEQMNIVLWDLAGEDELHGINLWRGGASYVTDAL
jgi:hypothetical protein